MTAYPDIRAGRRLNEDLLTLMLPDVVVKAVNTDRASTIVPALDPDLQFEAEANSVYLIEFMLWPAALLAADFRTEWQVPADALGLKMLFGPGSTASDGSVDNINMRCGVHQFATNVIYSGVRDSGGSAFLAEEMAIVTTVSAGTIGMKWAQGTSNATAARLCRDSRMSATRLA